jgi:hypothetical protein
MSVPCFDDSKNGGEPHEIGQFEYFSLRLGPLTRTYDSVDAHVRRRVRQWLGRKYRMRAAGGKRFTCRMLYDEMGLLELRPHPAPLPESDNVNLLSESRMRENGTSGSMSGIWKWSTVRFVRHRQPKGPATARSNLTYRATSRLYSFTIAMSKATCCAAGD